MHEFQSWTNRNSLVHLPTRRALFTWSNRRSGPSLQIFFTFFPTIPNIVKDISITLDPGPDLLRWRHTSTGELNMNDAYKFLVPGGPKVPWSKDLWNLEIPPSKTFLMWKILHHKIPSDDIISRRVIYLVSMCSLCISKSETIHHLFF